MDATLMQQRDELNEKANMQYSPDDFPGSKEWLISQKLWAAVSDFDLAHPEIIEGIKAERRAKDKAVAEEKGWI